ncbi:AMIN domain-containing protein [Nostoc sp. FACHB-152]|uniref:AMIN domain-containing protein n=1 Tax=unclassified Nostoc TaxID=2593658 RepID=UPI001687A085|nr:MULTISPECIES: AMIN domain-containing protein [unclassified Nostoc]MBD2447830.1 AMIN domain-containing protein [Nostoc sp. FACHB-152]MBD2468596.1 AMIN domain-containing protein [Nostoc sp. FACHB-145]
MHTRPKTKRCISWSQPLIGISLFSLYIIMASEAAITTTPVAKLNNWRFDPKASKLEFTLSAGTTPHYFYLSQPPRLVIDLPETKLGYVSTKQNYSGAIQSIRVSQLNASMTRIVLDLADGAFLDPKQVKLQPVSRSNPTRWVLRTVTARYGRSSPPVNLQPASVYSRSSPPVNLQPGTNPYNYYPQIPSSNLPSSSNYPQLPTTLPTITTNQQQLYITVPPLAPNNSYQLQGSILPPPNFPNQAGNLNNIPSVAIPSFPVPTVPSSSKYPPDELQIEVIEFGQPLPKPRYRY